jgi:glycerate kinase
VVGLGGSATNDGGAGMAQALGFRLYDATGNDLPPGGAALAQLVRIDATGAHGALHEARIEAACDVDNPLGGPRGASRVYGPQKGASDASIDMLDQALAHFAAVVQRDLGVDVAEVPGAGAAGGLGAGLLAFCGATLRPGVMLVAEACGLAEAIAGAALVITGEGRMDGQSAHGKAPVGVARLAREAGVPVVAVCGLLGPGWETVYAHGIDAVFPIAAGPIDQAGALRDAAKNLERTAHNIARLWHRGQG